MADIRLPGVHRKTAKGRVYYYHAATGARIKASPDDYAAFVAEVAALEAVVPPKLDAQPVSSLGGLITAYKRSPEWMGLAPDTHKSYQRAFNAVQSIDALPVDRVDAAAVLRIRDNVYARNGRWLANMVVKVLSVVLGWGVPRSYCVLNAAKGVPTIRRNRKAGVANKAWLPGEAAAVLDRASGGLRKAVALAYYCGLRKKDCVELPPEARSAGAIDWVQSKTGRQLTVFEAKRLTSILDAPDTETGETIVVTRRGGAYTRDGLDTMFHRLKVTLVAEGLIRAGLTFHGLRKSLGTDLANLGMSENDIAGALGQANPASARPYTVEHKQREAARKATKLLERRGKR